MFKYSVNFIIIETHTAISHTENKYEAKQGNHEWKTFWHLLEFIQRQKFGRSTFKISNWKTINSIRITLD